MKTHQVQPWASIWVKPRATMRRILNTNPFRWIIWLAVIQGVLSGGSWLGFLWTRFPQRIDYTAPLFLIATVIFGVIVALLNLYLGGWLVRLTGSWLGGRGSFIDVKCAIGWSFYPYIITSILAIVGYIFAEDPQIYLIIGGINVIAIIWAFIISLYLIAEAHRFGPWKAFGALLLAFVLVFVAIMLIALLVPLLSPLFTT